MVALAPLAAPFAASLFAIPLGATIGLVMWRRNPALRNTVSAICIMALLVALTWSQADSQASLRLLALTLPIAILILMPRLEKLDPVLLDAANASGAAPATRFRLVILPWLALPALFAFALCLAVTMSGPAATAIRQAIAG